MELQTTTNKWQIIAKFSLIYSLILIAFNLILYITGNAMKMSLLNILVTIVTISVSIYFGIISRRNNTLDGFISYGQGLGTGLLITVFAAVILTLYTLVFMKYIDPDFMDNMLLETKKKLIEEGKSEEEIEMAMKFSGMMKSSWVIAITGFFGNFFYGLIASLIVAIFTKKENPDSHYNSL